MRELWILAGLAACGPKPSTATTSDVGHVDPAPAARERVPCPTDQGKIDDLAKFSFGNGAHSAGSCTALWANEALWLIDGYAEVQTEDFEGLRLGRALVTPSGETRWSELEEPITYGEVHGQGPFEAVDLDGDGHDELLYPVSEEDGSYRWMLLGVYGVRDGALFLGGAVSLGSEHYADGARCDVQRTLIPGPNGSQLLEVVATELDGGDCDMPAGRHVHAWTGTELKEIEP